MDKAICGLLLAAVLAYLAYRLYRFLIKKEIGSCFGEPCRWQEEREKISGGGCRKIAPK